MRTRRFAPGLVLRMVSGSNTSRCSDFLSGRSGELSEDSVISTIVGAGERKTKKLKLTLRLQLFFKLSVELLRARLI